MANTIIKPTWAKHEKGVHAEDNKTQIRETDAFLDEREKETRTSKKAREWEKSRKKEWEKNKPEWKKKKLQEETKHIDETVRKLKEGGYLMENFKPAPGFILIKPDKPIERKTNAGVYLPGSVVEETCTAEVKRIGDPKQTLMGGVDKCPVKKGERCLYRHDTGLNLTVKGEKLLLISFPDILGTLEG